MTADEEDLVLVELGEAGIVDGVRLDDFDSGPREVEPLGRGWVARRAVQVRKRL